MIYTKLSEIIAIAENNDFVMHEYEEDDTLCGYELESWTNGGVNMIHFIDCRGIGVTPENILSELKELLENFDIDDKIDCHRQYKSYRDAFTIRQSVLDFEAYYDRFVHFVEEVEKAVNS